ncbi:hypothetical protein [Sediminicoccus rosea]|uniref:Uncharacterized protein n=1 Tax=Sediminicoccus rosea TaxID=1225128 RepID=A0ABZ0PNQ6_9PROT|nr:hypothetical protein [Sediminicoccus rosea]WPB87272.1 hypothetical protein R9Z33_10400 [Sediminicoccus rosea]
MRIIPLAAGALALGLLSVPADAGPKHGLHVQAPGPLPGLELVFWRAGGVTPGGTAWHAGGGNWGGGYRYGGAYHGYVGGYHPYPATAWRAPVVVAPYYHAPVGSFAAGALVGAAAGAAVGTAAASVAAAGQPNTTVINNYY